MNTRKTGFKVSLLAFRRRRLWTYSKVGKVLVGGPLSPESRVTASVPNSDSRSITRDALGLEVVAATKLPNTEESRSLERRHPLIPSSAPTGKVAPLYAQELSLAPAPARRPPWASGGGRPLWPEAEPLAGRPARRLSPLGAAPVSCSMLRPEVPFTADLPPGSLVPAVRLAAAAECDVVMAATGARAARRRGGEEVNGWQGRGRVRASAPWLREPVLAVVQPL